MFLKTCDRCGTKNEVEEEVKVEWTIFNYCNKCLLLVKNDLLDLRKKASKIVAAELEK